MITVLWVITVSSIVAFTGALAGRTTVSAARNRVQSERALWSALGCARSTQAEIDGLLGGALTLDEGALIWRTLDRRLGTRPPTTTCTVRLEAAGSKLDVNAATPEMIASLLRTLGEPDGRVLEMTDALMDWRDTNDVELPSGAERAWYEQSSRALPRNGPLADVRELALVRGFEELSRFAPVFATEPGRVSLAHASAEVLSAVPGITRETADLIASLAAEGTPVSDVSVIAGRVSSQSALELMSRYPEIVRATTADPDAWMLEVEVKIGEPATTVVVQWRLVRTGRRVMVVRSRTSL
jgi:general secretion pathway protein K